MIFQNMIMMILKFMILNRVENFLKDTCKDRNTKAFYNSKKGKELQSLMS